MSNTPCAGCGQLQDIPEYDRTLKDLYWRLKSGRQHIEPLVYTSEDFDDPHGEDEIEATKLAMERNMIERGLCPACGRPNLSGKTADDFYTEEEARELADMYAEMAAERRVGA